MIIRSRIFIIKYKIKQRINESFLLGKSIDHLMNVIKSFYTLPAYIILSIIIIAFVCAHFALYNIRVLVGRKFEIPASVRKIHTIACWLHGSGTQCVLILCHWTFTCDLRGCNRTHTISTQNGSQLTVFMKKIGLVPRRYNLHSAAVVGLGLECLGTRPVYRSTMYFNK